ncbi:hypothetical protein NG895_22810 [Aeoliella sp. ICT_H6.2]|uniref:Transposase IS200-like domain-containing protein n=1 Tax=Aeoliella straminimaris TaxID=2954799 RepID=A0A9X2JJH4_9BACT|nr:hypothetical protein [Aeoliella straminimaris]MCO6046738.1 hypothetical protein [Aeoliella straminimaris]
MPCYLFTYHAYGSWMPNRERGYVRRDEGLVAQDAHMDRLYVESMKGDQIRLTAELQRVIALSVVASQERQRFVACYTATDISHAHVLISWTDGRDAVKMRGLVKGSLSRALNAAFRSQKWFSEGGSRKRVRTRSHFDYLLGTYLPSHRGVKWSRYTGFVT